MKIRKISGELEEFDRRKLEESVRHAGASSEIVKRVSESIQPSEALSTEELRRRVAEELLRENSALSGAYLSTRTLRAKESSPEPSPGVVRIHADHLRGLTSGLNAMLYHGGRKVELRVEPTTSIKTHEMLLSKADMDKLGIHEGTRVQLRFPF